MPILKPLVLVLTAGLVPVAQSAAQTCLGSNSFANGKMALGAQATLYSESEVHFKRFGALGAYGSPKSWYADATVGTTSANVTGVTGGSTQTDFGGSLGYQFGVGDSPAEICPYAFAGYATITGFKTTSYGFGGGIGWRAEASDQVTIVPAAVVQWHGVSYSYTGFYSGSTSDSWVDFGANVGFIVNKQWAIVPGVLQSNQKLAKATVFTITVGYYWGK